MNESHWIVAPSIHDTRDRIDEARIFVFTIYKSLEFGHVVPTFRVILLYRLHPIKHATGESMKNLSVHDNLRIIHGSYQ